VSTPGRPERWGVWGAMSGPGKTGGMSRGVTGTPGRPERGWVWGAMSGLGKTGGMSRGVTGTPGRPERWGVWGAMSGPPILIALRETRGGWRHFVGFFASVALGVAALTSVGTLAVNVDRALSREARALMGGDLELRAMRPLGEEAVGAVERVAREGAAVTRVRELVAMIREPTRGGSLLVELKAVEPGYPLYGRLETSPGGPLTELLGGAGVLVQEDVLTRLGVKIGDRIVVGNAPVTIRGVVRKEPDSPVGFGLGPRVLISSDTLDATGLLQFGSRVRHRTLLRLPHGLAARESREAIARDISDPAIRVTAFNEAQPGLRRFFSQMATYLGLIGLVSLLVGGIGVASAVATFVKRQRPTIAILKVLGASSRVLLTSYLLQTQMVAVAGSALGVGLGVAMQPLIVGLLAGMLPIELSSRPDPWTLARAFIMGLLTALLCALWPLLAIRTVRPSILLRHEVDPAPVRRPWAAAFPVAAGLVALAFWQAGSWKLGGIFVGASAAALLLLVGLARVVALAARRKPRLTGLAWRQGVANLARPGGQTGGVVIALGVGVMLLVSVALLEASLGRQIDHEQRREAPSFFFIDIQPDQREAFARVVTEAASGAPPVLTPVVRSRLVALNGQPVTRAMVDGRRGGPDSEGARYLRREYVLTYAADLPAANVLVKGHWWRPSDWTRPLVSVEEAAAKQLGIDVGDRLTFDVQGVPVETDVTSIRKVDWQALSTNFFMILSPGALDGAPGTYVATSRVPAVSESRLQNAVVKAFPNVTAIPVRDVLERVAKVLDQMAVAIRVMAFFSIGAGLVVMISALAATRYARLHESVIWRTLGATRGVVARIFAVEYACLGVAAGLGGSALATALSWVVLRYILEVPWTFEPEALVLGVSLTVVVALAVGFLVTFRLLGEKPLPVLRQE
jgi:putative ABC transport system permease protein